MTFLADGLAKSLVTSIVSTDPQELLLIRAFSGERRHPTRSSAIPTAIVRWNGSFSFVRRLPIRAFSCERRLLGDTGDDRPLERPLPIIQR
jgi:hypothetical protein